MTESRDGLVFPIGEGAELVLRYDARFAAIKGSATIMAAAQEMGSALAVMHSKDALYGGAWRDQGWMGNLARIMSKTARLRNMLWADFHQESGEEPFTDTLQDLLNLCVFMILNRKSGNKWGSMMANGERQ